MAVAEEIRLIAGAKHGDHGNFQTLVELYMGRAIGFAMGYVRNRDDAVDLAQDAFYRVYKHLDRFREGERFSPWFFRILRNCCLNFLDGRRRARQVSIHPRNEDDLGMELVGLLPEPTAQVENTEVCQQLWSAMGELSVAHREIILLRHFQDLDYAAIAEVLEIPIGTVMSRLFHARKKLAALMEPYMEGTR
ncbi:MAG: sigma-70 family RNA polymerase sigma factor [Planctomycetes bacterium]|nr:sigma-70 family RNA polymerase sigma factor [Planctomycetota bacterium]MCB9888852.1 sigma-70 family RNA polymerase sigma factor [Planctomycetota bacterium]